MKTEKNIDKIPINELTYSEMKKIKLKREKNKKRELLPITEVSVGPMLHKDKAKIACDILLKDNGYTNVKVTTSDIPYRGF